MIRYAVREIPHARFEVVLEGPLKKYVKDSRTAAWIRRS